MTELWSPAGAGIYQLHRDGQAAPVTSLVDRSDHRDVQLDELSTHANWLPEQELVAQFTSIVNGSQAATSEPWQPPSGWLASPCVRRFDVLLGPDDGTEEHPLRAYLWPRLDADGSLILEEGEIVLNSHAVDHTEIGSHSSHAVRSFTNRRIVTTADLDLPMSYQEDSNMALGLVSPTMMEAVSAWKAFKRRGQNVGRRWVVHLRYEWISEINCFFTTRSKKKMFGGRGPETTTALIKGAINLPGRDAINPTLEWFRDPEGSEAAGRAFLDQTGEACRALGLGWVKTHEAAKQFSDATEVSETWQVGSHLGHAFPSSLLPNAAATTEGLR